MHERGGVGLVEMMQGEVSVLSLIPIVNATPSTHWFRNTRARGSPLPIPGSGEWEVWLAGGPYAEAAYQTGYMQRPSTFVLRRLVILRRPLMTVRRSDDDPLM